MNQDLDFLNELPKSSPLGARTSDVGGHSRGANLWMMFWVIALGAFLGVFGALVLHDEYAIWRTRLEMNKALQSFDRAVKQTQNQFK